MLTFVLTFEALFNNGVSVAFAEALADGLEQGQGNEQPLEVESMEEGGSTKVALNEELVEEQEGDKEKTPESESEKDGGQEAEKDGEKTDDSKGEEPKSDSDSSDVKTDPKPETNTEPAESEPVVVDAWDWTGKTDNLTLGSPDGLTLDVESLEAIVAKAQEGGQAEKTDDSQPSDAVDVLRALLPETISGTLDFTLALDPAVEGVDTGDHTTVVPDDTFTVDLPDGITLSDEMITNAEKGTFDIFQSDAEGDPTTVKIAEGTIQNEGTTLKVTFVEPTDTADGTSYYVGDPADNTVPATQAEGKEQLDVLKADFDLRVDVRADVLADDASQMTWSLQTDANDENIKQEAELALPGLTELAEKLGVEDAKDEETKDDTEEKAAPAKSKKKTTEADTRAVGDTTVVGTGNTGCSISTTWFDNNDTSHRGSTDEFKSSFSLTITIDSVNYVLKRDGELQIEAGSNVFTVPSETVNEWLDELTVSTSGNTWTVSANDLPEHLEISKDQGEDVSTTLDKDVSWSLTYKQPSGEQADASDYWYKLTTDKDDSTKQYMQLLKDVEFTFIGKLGNSDFEDTFGKENDNFKVTEYVNNVEQTSGAFEEYFDRDEQPKPENNQVTVSNRLPAYNLDGLPIEYAMTYNGTQEGDDYYQATYNNSGSGNHGSDVSAMWNGGSLTLTHVGNAQFSATKVWQDNDPADRSEVTYTLWRYSLQSLSTDGSGDSGVAPAVDNPYRTAAQVRLNGEFATVTVKDDALKANSFDIGTLFTEEYGEDGGLLEGKVLNLPKYDPEGYPYIYCVREEAVPSGYEQIFGAYNEEEGLYEDFGPQYTDVNGNLVSAVSDSWERDDNDRFVYNGRTLCNHRSETVEVKQDKTWKISAFQDQLQNVHAEFTLYQHVVQEDASNPIEAIVDFFAGGSEDKTWAVAKDRDGNEITKTIEGFKSETLTQTISGYYPQYGPLGNKLEYKWVETGVTQTLADGTTFDTNFKFNDPNDPTQGATFQLQLTSAEGTPETLQFSSTIDEETGTIVNAFANEAYERVDKWWELPAEDGKGSGQFVQYYPGGVENPDSTIKMSLYRDNQLIGTFTMDGKKDAEPQPILTDPSDDLADFEGATWQETSGYHIDFEGLPQYSETGHKYSYLVMEQQKDGWYATRNYDPEEHLTTFRNFIPEGEGSLLYVSKDWVDGSDSAHRNTSVVQLVAKHDMHNEAGSIAYKKGDIVTKIGDNSDPTLGDTGVVDDQGRIYLSEANGWFAEITIGINGLSAEDFDIVEVGLQSPAADEDGDHTFYPTYTYGEESYGQDAETGETAYYENAYAEDSEVANEIWAHIGWEEGDAPRIATDQHVYEVTYGYTDFEVGTTKQPVLTVRNRRIGIVNLDATKTWVDTLTGEEVGERPDAELVLSSDASGGGHKVFSIGNGQDGTTVGQVYVQLPGGNKIPLYKDRKHEEGQVERTSVPLTAAASKEEADTGEPYLEDDKLVVPIDKTQNSQAFHFYGLPKYDGNGEVHSYSIVERWADNVDPGAYRYSSKATDYTVGPLHFNDSQTFEFSNQPVDTVTKVFYKQWKDTYVNEQHNQRPDIYLTLYKVSEETGNKPVPVDGYVHFLWENAETVQGEDPNYWQKVTISGLDKYDELGDEIQYYAAESMSITNPADLDYTDVSFSDEKTNYDPDGNGVPVEGTEFDEESTDFMVYVGTETGDAQQEDYAHWAIHAGGTFVNRIDSNLMANGTKIWRNVPGDFDLENDMPEITVYLQRRLVPEDSSTAWAVPKIVEKDSYKGNSDDVFWNDEDSAAAGYGVEKKCSDDSEVVAYTVTFKKDAATNQWTYQLWHTGLNGAADDESQVRLPKYDENGNLYQYRALEAMWGLVGSAAWGEDTGAQIDPTGAVRNVFDVSHGETGSFILINTYDSPEGNLTVRKIFDGRDEGDHYPNVTFTLYRQYAKADGTPSDAEAVGSPKTISRDEFEQNRGKVDVTFENLDIYAPNGEYWQYYVVESTIGGYETKVVLGNADTIDEFGELGPAEGTQSPNAVTTADGKVTGTLVNNDEEVDITYANTYDTDQIKLTGTKEWADNGNLFGSRPDSIDLYLSAKSGSGQVKAEEQLPVKDAVDSAATDPYVVWTKPSDASQNWTFTIYNLDRWAPDGTVWTYTVREKLPTSEGESWEEIGYVATTENATATAPSDETKDSAALNRNLKNSLRGSAGVTKTWVNDNASYGLRPSSVTVTLQAQLVELSGEGSATVPTALSGWREASALLASAVEGGTAESVEAALGDMTDVELKNNGTSGGSKTWDDLPIQVEIDDKKYGVEYRVVETQVGDQPVELKKVSGSEDVFVVDEDDLYGTDKWYYSYTPSQTTGVTGDSFDTTLINTFDPTSVSVTKTWDDEGNAWLTRPSTSASDASWSVTFALQRKSIATGSDWEWVLKYGKTSPTGGDIDKYDEDGIVNVTLGGTTDTLERTWSNLPKRTPDGSATYTYRVVEVMPDGYEPGNEDNEIIDSSKDNGGNVVAWVVVGQGYKEDGDNIDPQSYTNKLRTVSLTGTKAWEDYETGLALDLDDYQDADASVDGKQLSLNVIDLRVYRRLKGSTAAFTEVKRADGKQILATWTQQSDNGPWTYTFTGLPETDQQGKAYEYTVREVAGSVDGFYPTYSDESQIGSTVDQNGDITWTGQTVTNTATRFKLDKRSDWPKTGEKELLNNIELTIKGTGKNADKTYAVWTRDANGDETAEVWVNGTTDTSTGGVMTSSKNVGWIIGLAAGNYVVTETGMVPEGYAKAPDVPITIGKDGKVSSSTSGAVTAEGANPGGTVTVTAVDPVFRAHFSIDKRLDDANKTSLKGVKFELWQKSENGADVQLTDAFTVNGTWNSKSDGSGVKRIDDGHGEKYTTLADGLLPGEYYLKEVATTDDALMPTDDDAIFEFTIVRDPADASKDHHGKVVAVTDNAAGSTSTQMLNTPFKADFELTKVDATSGDGIKGATFKLEWRATGSTGGYTVVNDKLTTGDNGVLTFSVAKKGQYCLTETANTGYDAADFFQATFALDDADHGMKFELNQKTIGEIDFKIKNGSFDGQGNVSNTRLFGKIQLEKSAPDVSDTKINGAQFKLQKKDANGDWTDLNITDENGADVTFVSGSSYTLNDGNTKVDSTTTSNNGVVLIDHLQWGTYRFVEIAAPDGYLTPTGDAANSGELVVDATHGIATASGATMKNTPTNLNVRKTKTDGTTLVVAGVKFTVTPANGYTFAGGSTAPIDIQTGANGIASLAKAKLVVGGHYLIEETEAPRGYKIVKGQQEIVVNADGSISLAGDTTIAGYGIDSADKAGNSFTVTLADEPVTLNLVKKDLADPDGASLDGATFKLQGLGADGDSSRSFTLTKDFAESNEYLVRNDDGSYTIEGLLIAGQHYELTESAAPDGYLPASDILRFTVDAETGLPERTSGEEAESDRITLDGNTATVTALDEATSFSLKKVSVDQEGNELVETALSGARFVVTPVEGSTFANAQGNENTEGITIETNDKGIAGSELDGRLIVGSWYSLTEAVPPAGHELNTSVVYFSPQKDGSYKFSTMADGATDGLPSGYRAATADEATMAGLELIAQDTELIVGLQKTDLNNMPVPGATFTIEALNGSAFADGTPKKTFTANGDKAFVSLEKVLVAGDSYAITEVTAPAGYETIDTGVEGFKFKVENDGTITAVSGTAAEGAGFVVNTEGVTIQAKDRPIEVQLKKVSTKQDDDGNDVPLTGATFDVYEGGTMLGTIVTGADGIAYNADANGDPTTTQAFAVGSDTQLEAGKTYTLVETEAPAGYELVAGTLTFTVGEDGELTADEVDGYTIDSTHGVVTITAADQPIEVALQKKGSDSGGELLPGASYELYRGESATGTPVWTGATTADGALELTGLIGGQTYTLHEASAPAGYELMADVTFTVGTDGTVTFKDEAAAKEAGYETSGDGAITITATDTAIELTLAKQDLGDKSLSGAKFEITGVFVNNETRELDAQESAIEFTMGEDDVDLTALTSGNATYSVVAGKDYTVTEVTAPKGYEQLGSFTFTVKTDGTISSQSAQAGSGEAGYVIEKGSIAITAHDAPIEIGLAKQDSTGNKTLSGAEFKLEPATADDAFAKTESGEITGITVDNATKKLSAELIAGNSYALTETKAPAGYELIAGSLTFTVNVDGTIAADPDATNDRAFTIGNDGVSITAKDAPIQITLNKEGSDKPAFELDATFELTGYFANLTDGTVDLKGDAEERTVEVKNGTATIDGLVAGQSYTLTETEAPEGYEKIADSLTFTVNADGTITAADDGNIDGYKIGDGKISIVATDTPIKIELTKRAIDSDKPLPGAEFELSGKFLTNNGTVAEQASKRDIALGNDEATAVIGGLVVGEKYVLTETVAPAGYEKLGTFTFQVDDEGKIVNGSGAGYTVEDGKLTIVANDTPIEAKIVKTDKDGKSLSGATFTITNTADADDVKTVTTGTDGSFDLDSHWLVAGNTYTIEETSAPDTYELAGKATFKVIDDGSIVFLNADGTDATAAIKGEKGSGTYLSTNDEGVAVITATDTGIAVQLTKVAKVGTSPLAGAVFELAENGKVVATLELGKTGMTALPGLVAGHTYTLTETVAPAGFELNDTPYEFTVKADGTIQADDQAGYSFDGDATITITAEDTPIEVTLDKRDLGDTALDGAVFSITGTFAKADGTVGAEETRTLTLEDDTITIDGLIASRKDAEYVYTLSETTAPAGYELVPDFTFKVDEAGNVVAVSGVRDDAAQPGFEVTADVITAHDEPIQIELVKQGEDGTALTGAEFTLSGDFADGTTEKDVTPGTTIDGLIAGEKYVLTETVAPDGYEKLGSVELTVAADGTVSGAAEGYEVDADGVTVVATDIAIEARIAKVDGNGEPLAGATFTIANADDPTDVRTVTTGEDGTVALDDAWLVAGRTYTVVEATAPAGYELAGEASFTVAEDGTVSLVADDGSAAAVVAGREGSGTYEATVDGRVAVITATDAAIAVQLVKVSGDTPLAGAEFELTPAKGSAFADGTTDPVTIAVNANGLAAVPGLVAGGTYELREAVAPAGYELNESTFVFAVSADGTVTTVGEDAAGYALVDRGGTPTIVADDAPIEATLVKTDLSGAALKGAEFTLSGEFANADGTRSGTAETRTVKVGEDGSVDLSGLIAGESYELTETVAPRGYDPLSGSVTLVVREDGTLELAKGTSAAIRDLVSVEDASGVAVVTVRNKPTPELGLSRTGDVTSPAVPVAIAAGGLALVAVALSLRRRRNR